MDPHAVTLLPLSDPAPAGSLFQEGLEKLRRNNLEPALELFMELLDREPDNLEALRLAAIASLGLWRVDQGLELLAKAREGYLRRGRGLKQAGNVAAAACALAAAADMAPLIGEALANKAANLREAGNAAEAEACARKALDAAPEGPSAVEALHNLGLALRDQGKPAAAEIVFRQALHRRPHNAKAWNNLGNALSDQGLAQKAQSAYGRSLQLAPDNAQTLSNLLLTMNYRHDLKAEQVAAAHSRWMQQFEASQPAMARTARRKKQQLRLGFVSADFRTHSVAFFIEPVLRNLRRNHSQQWEIYCYSATQRADAVTGRFMAAAHEWRDIGTLPARKAAEIIREDSVDILVDLGGHTAQSRLPVFALQPAPIQVSWIGYPNTTGMQRMHYRLVDSITDPRGDADALHSERLLRLDPVFLCYQPPSRSPHVTPPPALAKGHVTFGSFNNLAKINPAVLDLWAAILLSVPGSRLLLKSRPLADQAVRQRMQQELAHRGVQSGRVEFLPRTPGLAAHLSLYGQVDIALDTFPYNGATTTCEALWMGAPTLTLTGDRHAGRVGATLLSAAGLHEWIAKTPEAYMQRAADFAADLDYLQRLRSEQRDRMAASPLCDGPGCAERLNRLLSSLEPET